MIVTLDHNHFYIGGPEFEAVKVWFELHSEWFTVMPLMFLEAMLSVAWPVLMIIIGVLWVLSIAWIPALTDLEFHGTGKIPLLFMLPFKVFKPSDVGNNERRQVFQRLEFLTKLSFKRLSFGLPFIAPLVGLEMYLLRTGKIAKLPKKFLYRYTDLQYDMYMNLCGQCHDVNHNYMDITDYMPPRKKVWKDLQDVMNEPDYSFYDYQTVERIDWEMINGRLRKTAKRLID